MSPYDTESYPANIPPDIVARFRVFDSFPTPLGVVAERQCWIYANGLLAEKLNIRVGFGMSFEASGLDVRIGNYLQSGEMWIPLSMEMSFGSEQLWQLEMKPYPVDGFDLYLVELRPISYPKAEDLHLFHQTFIDSIPDPILVVSHNFIIEKVNKAAESVFGNKLLGQREMHCYSFLHQRNEVCAVCPLTQPNSQAGEFIEAINGRIFQVKTTPIRSADGKLVRFIDLLRDVTEIKQSEQLFKHIFENAPVGIAQGDVNTNILRANKYFGTMLGYTLEEMLHLSMPDISYAKETANEWETIQKVFNNELDSYTIDKRLKKRNGELIWVKANINAIRKHNREVAFFLIIAIDIDKEKKHLFAFQEKEATLQTVINNLPFGLWARDNKLVCYLQNQRSQSFWGDMSHKAPHELTISADVLEAWHAKYARVLKGETVSDEFNYINPEGNKITLKSIVAPILIDQTIQGMVGLDIDVTAQKQYEKNLKEAKERAEESDKLKTAFLHNMSHELRTPMNGIIGFSRLLQANELSYEKRVQFTRIIVESAQQLLLLVENLIDLSRIQTKQLEVRTQPVALAELFRVLADAYAPKADERGLTFEAVFDNRLRLKHIETDNERLRQILDNLISNALKFTAKGKIRFSCELNREWIEWRIEDTGPGISPEQEKIIFEGFRKTNVAVDANVRGAGLGLAISKALATMLKGSLSVVSSLGKGSCFILKIPHAIPTVAEAPTAKSEELPGGDLNGKTILVAEDEDINYLYLEAVLKQWGCAVIRAENGQQAIEICINNKKLYSYSN